MILLSVRRVWANLKHVLRKVVVVGSTWVDVANLNRRPCMQWSVLVSQEKPASKDIFPFSGVFRLLKELHAMSLLSLWPLPAILKLRNHVLMHIYGIILRCHKWWPMQKQPRRWSFYFHLIFDFIEQFRWMQFPFFILLNQKDKVKPPWWIFWWKSPAASAFMLSYFSQ